MGASVLGRQSTPSMLPKPAAIMLGTENSLETVQERREFLLSHRIALWDVIESCEIVGSSDSSIKDVKVNDLGMIVKNSQVRHVFANGGKSYEMYGKYGEALTGIPAIKLPSTSPANAAFSLEKLAAEWGCILEHL